MKPTYKQLEKKVKKYSRELKRYQSIVQIDEIMRTTTDLELLLKKVLDFMLKDFDADRTFLYFPCDPDSSNFYIPYECTKPEYPGFNLLANKKATPNEGTFLLLKAVLAAKGPLVFNQHSIEMQHPSNKRYLIKTQLLLAIHPKIGKPWMIGMHQCSYDREWSEDEKKLLVEISYRFSDSLSNLLLLQNLRKSEERFKLFIMNFPGIAFIGKPAEQIIYANQAYGDLLGRKPEDLLTLKYENYLAPDILQRIKEQDKEIVKSKKMLHTEEFFSDKSGVKQWLLYKFPLFQNDGSILIGGMGINITEKKQLEDQVRQMQKLESIGSLSGGVAHDFNNYLSVIIGYTQLILMDLPENDPLRSDIEAILNAGHKGEKLTKQLLAFSRKQIMEIKVINLNGLINDMVGILGRLIGENIELKMILDPNIANIKVDQNQVEQVVMNLLVNARDAMKNGGRLVIETSNIELNEDYCNNHTEVAPGSYVMLVVMDTGHGFTQEIKEKIFEPFFTTKKTGKGTGLGLSTSYGIIKQLKGHISVYSEVGKGTAFRIYFPAVMGKKQKTVQKSTQATKGKGETILVIDDDQTIRLLAKKILERFNYKVIVAETCNKVIELCKNKTTKIDLLLSDVIMPGMNGRELAEKVQSVRPDLKVLFMSGYTDNIITFHIGVKPDFFYITKPLVPKNLASKISEVLNSTERHSDF